MDHVTLTPLKIIHRDDGNILHAMKNSDYKYSGFGEAYFSTVLKGKIKGWKKHVKMTLNLVVPVGEIQFVIYNEKTRNFCCHNLSQVNYKRLTIGPGLWVAFKGIQEHNMLLNIASIEHDSSEAISLDISKIHYDW